jgi:hypothetical protein
MQIVTLQKRVSRDIHSTAAYLMREWSSGGRQITREQATKLFTLLKRREKAGHATEAQKRLLVKLFMDNRITRVEDRREAMGGAGMDSLTVSEADAAIKRLMNR